MENILTTRWSNDFIRHLPYNETWTVKHTITTMKMKKGDTLIQNDETQFNCT